MFQLEFLTMFPTYNFQFNENFKKNKDRVTLFLQYFGLVVSTKSEKHEVSYYPTKI